MEVEDLLVITEELKLLKQFFLNSSQYNIPENIKQYVTNRIENLITELDKVQDIPFTEAYIG